jgi:GGDEF domain-containing protein
MKRATTGGRGPRQGDLGSILDEESGWYQGWYFDLRLEEEVARSTRYDLPLSLLVLRLTEPLTNAQDERLFRHVLSDIVERKLRRSDIPGLRGADEFATALPHTNRSQAEFVGKRLAKWFDPYRVDIGIASFPEDGREPEELLRVAKNRAGAVSGGTSPLR